MRSKLFLKLIFALPILAISIPAFAGYQVTSQSGDSAAAEVVAADPQNPAEFIVVAQIGGNAGAVSVQLVVNGSPATATFTNDFTLSFPNSCPQNGGAGSITFSATPNGPSAYTLDLGGFNAGGGGAVGGSASFNCSVTINAVDDFIDEDSESLNLTITGDPSVVKDPLIQNFTIADNDTAALVATNTDWNGTDAVVLSQKLTSEDGDTATFWVELATQPLATVTVDLAVSDTGEALISSVATPTPGGTLTLTFTDATWDVGQEVTITGQDDGSTPDGNIPYTVSIVTTDEADNKYDNLSTGPVNAVNADNDTAGNLRFTQSSQSGDEGDAMTLTVERINGSSGEVSVDYAITNVGSTTGADYNDTTGSAGTLTFADGVVSQDISITLVDDTLWEPAVEDFTVTLSNATGGASILSPSAQTVSINPSDAITITISAPSPDPVPEGNTGDPQVPVTFTVDYTGGTLASPMTISWMTVNGTATGGADFVSVPATNFDLPVSGDPVNLVVNVIGDDDPEGDETFSVQLSESFDLVTLASGGTSQATIQDDDASDDGTFSITDISPNPVMESAGTVTVTVTRAGATPFANPATIDYGTSDGTAVQPGDYVTASGTLNFPADSTSELTFNVTINDDAAGEPDEAFTVTISNPSAGSLGVASADVTIIGDPTVTFNPTSYNVGEADGTVTVYVSRANVDDGAVSVDYTTTDGSAVAGEDYTTTAGTLNWTAAELGPKPINIPILADADATGPESFTVDLSNCGNCTIVANQATVNISEGAPPETTPGTLSFDPVAIAVNESVGNASLLVTRTSGSDGAISVDFDTSAGTASTPADFTAVSGTLNWNDGETGPKLISVPVVDDNAVESNETFTVRLIPGTETGTQGLPTIGASPATVTIVDNDESSAGAFSVLDTNVSEGDGIINVTVTRDGGSDGPVSVDFTTADNTAVAGSDYTATNGTLNWADGDSAAKTIPIQILDDAVIESQERFTVDLSNPQGDATITKSSANVFIFDDDGGGNFSISDVTVFEIDQQATVTVTRSNDNDTAAYVAWETRDGTAQDENGDNDYKSDSSLVSGELVWLDGDTSSTRTITIQIVPDTKVEGDEWFSVTLVSVQGDDSVISKADGIVTIKDPIPIPTLSEWAMGLMVLLLLGIGAYSLPLRRRVTVARK